MTAPAQAGIFGSKPEVKVGPGNPEAEKYGKLWATEEYRKVSPGEQLAHLFLQHARPRSGAHVVDFGCGTGRGALQVVVNGAIHGQKYKVTMVDFVRNCLDPDIENMLTTQPESFSFVKADLEQKIPVVAEYGICFDVLEHIPTDKVDAVLNNILMSAQHVFFSISTTDDSCGTLIDETLHLTVKPYSWWLEKLTLRDCVIHYAEEIPGGALFYVSAWTNGIEIAKTGVLNASEEQAQQNVRHNIAQGWQQVAPHMPNETELIILGGGPSMPQFEKQIRAQMAKGMKVVTLNGAYNWALERGIAPVNQVIVDIRPFNARFTKPVREDCMYFIGSQCDPSVFDGLPKDRTFIFHTMPALMKDILNEYYGEGKWFAVGGGSTVFLRAIPLFRMLGFTKFHVYGVDSCLGDFQQHHAYAQPENDNAVVIPVHVSDKGHGTGRTFYCHPWMASQASEWLQVVNVLGDEIEVVVYGDGLIAHMMNTEATELDRERD